MPKTHVNCHVFVDFDGTIVPADATDMLFARFAEPAWLDIEADWKAGRIGSRECMARQVALLRASPEQFDALVATIDVDPSFPRFVELCRSRALGITVVSDGLDRTIAAVLERAGLDIEFHANRLEWLGGERWRLGFPNARSDCRTLSGNCKCQFPQAERGKLHVMIGDGRSDFCIAGRVDVVLAKGALALHCSEQGMPHYPIADFKQACELFGTWLGEAGWPASCASVQFESATK